MKKLIILALALIFAVFSCLLVACDDETESSSSESEQESQSQMGNESETESEADDSNNDVVASEGLSFELDTTTDTYTVVGIGECKDTNLVIPSTHNGKRVTSIGARAFWFCTSLTSITIPDSVTPIGREAFYGCKSLTSDTWVNALSLLQLVDSCEINALVQSSFITPVRA